MAQDTKFRSTRPPTRPPIRSDSLASGLRVKLDDEIHVLDALVSSLSRGQNTPEIWILLHEAAVRDGRIPNLAIAYERLTQDRKLKFLPTALQCEVLMHAATFFADVFGDPSGSVGYLEQVLVLSPAHAEAFTKIEAVLTSLGNGLKLADVYAQVAAHRPGKDEQLTLLRRAAELADGFSEEHDRVIKIYQHILRIEPGDQKVRRSLEDRLRDAGKFRELGRLLEQQLAAPEASAEDILRIRERLISLYAGDLVEPDRALPHIEEVLRDTPGHELARGAAHRLVSHKSFGGRAAAALADAYARLETFPESAAMLEISMEALRGPKRAEVQKRLGIVRQDKLGDAAGAHPMFEAVVALDPSDEDVRQRYRRLSVQLGKQLEAARLLSRAAVGVREPTLKGRLGVEVGDIYLAAGEFKLARSAFSGVVDAANGDADSVLHAARALADLHGEAKEHKALAQVLELLARIEPEDEARHLATQRLALLAENDLSSNARAIDAWRSLLGTPFAPRALEALDRLYTASDAHEELVAVLDKRVALTSDRFAAQALAFRATELRAAQTKDRAQAIRGWMDFLGTYGASREAHAKVIPLLEQEKKWSELAAILTADLALAAPSDRVAVLLRLAQVRLTRQEDPEAAFELYRQAWAIDPSDQTCKQGLEKLLSLPATRLQVAALLEPVYRADGSSGPLLRVLEARAEATPDMASRLVLLDEAIGLAEHDLRDFRRALSLAGVALGAALVTDRAALSARLDVVDRLAGATGDFALHAKLLSDALADRAVDDPALADLARRTGAALVAAGDPSAALEVYRRALVFEPSSQDLLGRIDGLLAQGGRPEERMALYRAALAQAATPERRRELFHSIATLQRRDLKDVRAAIETWRQALAENPADGAARAALLDAYEAAGDWRALYDELARALPEAEGERRVAALTKLAEVATQRGDDARALEHYRELLKGESIGEPIVAAATAAAERAGDFATLAGVLEHRVARAADPPEQCAWLERLAEIRVTRLGEHGAGALAYKRAAGIAEGALADEEHATRLYEQAAAAVPSDRDTAEHLVKLYVRGQRLAKLPAVVKGLVDHAVDEGEAARRLLEFEPHVAASGGTDTWLALAEPLLAKGAHQGELGFARARILASDPARADLAAREFRDLITAARGQGSRLVDAFDAFLAKCAPADRKDDRRFLFAWKADHAPEGQRAGALIAWAHAEESTFADPKAAVDVYRRVLAVEPERGDALEASVRLLRQLGDVEGALAALIALRDSSEGPSRRERDLEIADLLLSSLDRPEEALSRVAPLIEAGPTDAGALGVAYRALEHPRGQEKAAALLERAASLAEDEEQALLILRTLLAMPKAPGLRASRRRWFESLLDHYESEPKVALLTALSAAAEMPADEGLWGRAEKLARSLEQPILVAEAYRQVLEQPLDPDLAASIGRRAVDYREEWFDDTEAVIVLLKRVLEISPQSGWARDRLKLAFGSGERWEELFALYDDAIDRATQDNERVELLAEAAQAAKDFAADADRAIGYFERLLVLRPDDRRVSSQLERLYERQGKIQPLIDLLSRDLAKLTGEKAQQMRLRIAGLFLRERRHDGSAFKLIEEVLRDDPERADAFTLLEEIVLHAPPETAAANGTTPHAVDRASVPPDVEGDASPASMAPGAGEEPPSVAPPALWAGQVASGGKGRRKKRVLQVRERAALLLKERYIAQAKPAELARVLEVELSLAPGHKERAKKHQELLTLKLETLKDDRGAFEHAAALLALEPRMTGHRKTLSDLADRLSAWERFGEVLVSTAESSSDEPLATRLLVEAAEIYRDHVRRDERAIDLFASALARSAKERDLALATARDLDALLDRAGRAEERCGVLEKIVALETDAGGRRAALSELSITATVKVGDPQRAIRAWRKYIDEGGREIEAWEGLIAILRRAERWTDLVDALEQHAAMADRDRARADLVEAARIYCEKLGVPERAVEAWLDVRKRFGVGEETFSALSHLFESMDRWEDLARLVLDEAKELLGAPEAPGAELRLVDQKKKAELAVQHVLDRVLAIAVCQRLFDVCVACWLPPLADDPASRAAAAWSEAAFWALDELVRMAIEDHDYPTAVDHMLGGSRYVFDRARARHMRRQAALVCFENLADPQRAVAVYRDLLTEDDRDLVADAVVPELARLFAQLSAFSDLTELWEKQAARHQGAGSRELAAELWAKAGELAEKRLVDIDRAIADYRKSADNGGQEALRELARLYGHGGEHLKAAEALERLTQPRSPDNLAADTLALASAYLAAGDREHALERLEKAVAAGAQPRAIRARLREFYREERDFTKLAELLRVEAEEADNRATRLELLREAAHLHLDQRNDPNAAIPLLDQARRLTTDDSSIGLTLARALVLASRLDEASGILRSELERYGNRKPKERAIVHFELARVLLQMDERAGALAELDLAAKIDPGHPGILCMLGKLSAEEGQLERAQRTLRALLLVLGRTAPGARVEVSRGEVLFELAIIAQKEKETERADELIESALHASSENPHEAESFERALRKRGSFELLARSLEARLSASPQAETRAAILRDLALLYDETHKLEHEHARLKRHADQTLRELKESPPASDVAWTAMETLYERLGEHDKLADLLSLRVAAGAEVETADYADLLYRLAKIRLTNVETIAEGTELLERALDIVPQADRAAEALRPAVEGDGRNERVLRLYERVTRGRGREAAHADALFRLIDLGFATSDESREGVSLALAASNEPLATSILAKLLESDDLDEAHTPWARRMLAELYTKAGDLARAADLKELVANAATGDERRALLLEVAQTARGPLRDLPRAARIYAKLRDQEPADRDIWEPLLAIYRSLGDTEGLIALIADTLPLIESPEERNRLRFEEAQLLLARPDTEAQAADLLQDVLEEEPSHREAAVLLSDLLQRRGDTDQLSMLLARQLDAAKDRGDIVSILSLSTRLGTLLEESGRILEALDTYHATLDWDPQSRTSLHAILRLSETRGDSFEIAEALEKLLAVETGETAAGIARRLFALRAEQGDAELAERALEAGLNASPENTELSELLIQRYQARGAHRELAVLLREAFDRSPDSAAILFALLDAYRNLGELEAAVETVTIALGRAPGLAPLYRERATLLEALGRSGEAIGDFARAYEVGGVAHLPDFVQALEREASHGSSAGDRGTRLRLAQLLCQTGLVDQARTHLEGLLEQNAYDADALMALAEIETKGERWDAASAILSRLVVVIEGDAIVEVALRLAEACERAGRPEEAQGGLERAIEAAPGHPEVRTRLRQIYEKSGASAQLGQLILEEAAQETDVAARFGLLWRAAELLLGEEGDPIKATEVLEEARALRPEDDAVVLLLGRAYVASGRAPEALLLYRSTVTQRKGRRSKQLSAIHREISRIQLGGGDLSSALEALTRAFEMDLQNGEVALELGLLAKGLDDQELAGRAFRSVTFMKAAPPGGDGATSAAKGLSYYFLGRMAKDSGDIRKARLLAQKALIEDPNLEQAKAILEEMKSLP